MKAHRTFEAGAQISARDTAALIKEAQRSQEGQRWLIYDRIARDFGQGFADAVKRQVEAGASKRKGGR
jgi:hypothetical protein